MDAKELHMKRLSAVGLALAGTLLVAGCATGAPSDEQTGSDDAEAIAACIESAEAAVEAGRAELAPSVPNASVDVSANEGKTIWYISATMQLETMIGFAQGVQEAADASGLALQIFDGANSPQKYNDGITQAVAQNADGIILQGIDPALVEQTLAEAVAAGIPVVDAMNGDPDDALQDGILSHITVNFTEGGKLLADYILAETGCEANVLELTSSLYVALQNKSKGFNDEIVALCPWCVVDTQEINFADFVNSVNTVVRTAVQRNPDLNFVNAADDGIAFFVGPVLEGLDSDLPMVAGNGAPANMDSMRNGGNQVMNLIFPPLPYMGWVEVDRLHRALLGEDVPSGAIGQQIVDTSTVKPTEALQLPAFDNFRDLFMENWGVK